MSYFCAAFKTARDIVTEYCETPVGSLTPHKFIQHVIGSNEFRALPANTPNGGSDGFLYAVEVYVDNFVSIVIPTSQKQLVHVATAIMS